LHAEHLESVVLGQFLSNRPVKDTSNKHTAELLSLASVLPVATCAMMREVVWITYNSFVGSNPVSLPVSGQR
jgi:hypothetical protein